MKIIVKYIAIILGVLFLTFAEAETPNSDNQPSMLVQIDREEIALNRSTIESATIVPVDEASDEYGVSLKLKDDAATKFSELTAKSIGKRARIIFNGALISSPMIQGKLGAEFFIAGLTKIQAQGFVESLSLRK